MPNENLLNYIKQARISGLTNEVIKTNLLNAGWTEQEINQALGNQPQPGQQPVGNSWKQILQNNKKYAIALVVIAVLVLGGYKGYSYFISDPSKIWEASTKKMASIKSAKFKVEASYFETRPEIADDDTGFNELLGNNGEFKISATGEGSMLIKKELADADYDMNSTLTTKLGSLTVSLGFESRKVGDNIYYKTEGNPFLSFFGGSYEDNKAQWVKISLQESRDNVFFLTDIQKNQIIEAFNKAKLMSPEKLLGSEKINGVATWHYSARLDKNALKSYFEKVQKIVQMEEFKDSQALIDKLELQKLELWLGKSDRRIYQAVIETSTPSFLSLSLGSARTVSRDAKRLADIRQIQTALELFYNDNNRYPVSFEEQSFSSYLSYQPTAPSPADGACTEENNKYQYEQLQSGASYKLSFCLGHDAAGYGAGLMEANPTGIMTKTPSNTGNDMASLLAKIPFTGVLQIKLNLSDFDSPVAIEEPANAFDVGTSTRNSKRLADIRQIQTALELFLDDYGYYPFSQAGSIANDKITDYLSVIPQAPTPADGACTESNNKYYYTWISAKEYSLTFCLGAQSGGYSGGVHTASPAGIR